MRLRYAWREFFDEWDILICPQTATPAFPHDHGAMPARILKVDSQDQPYFQQLYWACLITASYLPSTVFPTGPSLEGLPIGLQAVGAEYDDYATIDEIDPASGEVVWRFRAEHPQAISSFVMGGAQRLPNGNTHVTSGQHGHLFEVTPDGAVVWEFLSPVSSFGPQERPLPYPLHHIQNSRRYAADHPALQGRALQPIGSILELEPRPALGAVLATAGLRALHGGALAALGALLLAWILWRSLAALRRRRARQRVAGASA